MPRRAVSAASTPDRTGPKEWALWWPASSAGSQHATGFIDAVTTASTNRPSMVGQAGQQLPPPVELTTRFANWSLSPVLTYHSQRAPSGPVTQVSVLAA
jgi:hypothetical protein